MARCHGLQVGRAAELHDVGKVAMPDAILHKPGPLDDRESTIIRGHTVIGERTIAAAPALVDVASLVRSSHERFDGEGYPDGLKGTDIPIGARILAVCDSFTAMTADRSHRPAIEAAHAILELRHHAGTQFDPIVVDAFCAERLTWNRDDQPHAHPIDARGAADVADALGGR
ncbi:MAG: HD-GYP domain-containing protein [Solirubrobacteraceae bacterium]